MTQEMTHGLPWFEEESKENILVALQQMFPASADKKEDEVESFTKSYQKYKREYVKHLVFNTDPENRNLSIGRINKTQSLNSSVKTSSPAGPGP